MAAAADRLPLLLTALDARHGRPVWQPTGRPLAELIQTVLSQHTSDLNSGRAYRSLAAAFPDGDGPDPDFAAVRDAPPPLVVAAIRSGGLAEVKASRIQTILRALSVDGQPPRLPDLAAMPLAEAKTFLTRLPGVGPKTAACVLLFAVGLPALPVDTHVHRVSRRLGLIPSDLAAEPAHAVLEAMTPANDVFRLHVDLIRHGRTICRAPRPRCADCPVQQLCPSAPPTQATHQLSKEHP